jgi:hypothetical protein
MQGSHIATSWEFTAEFVAGWQLEAKPDLEWELDARMH